MEFYRISCKNYILNHQFTSFVSFIIPLPNYKIWVYFGNGTYTIWDLLNQTQHPQKIGKIKPELKYAEAFNESTIVLYDAISQQMSLLDLLEDSEQILEKQSQQKSKNSNGEKEEENMEEEKQIQEKKINSESQQQDIDQQQQELYSQNMKKMINEFEISIPTNVAVNGANRNDNNAIQEVIENTGILIFPESNAITLTEKKFLFNNNQTENIITTYQPFKKSKEEVNHYSLTTPQRFCKITALNKKDMVIVWMPQFTKRPINFFTFNIFSNQPHREFTLEQNVSLTILSANNFGDGKVIFWANTAMSNDGIPVIIVYDTETKEEQKESLDLYFGEEYLLNEIIEVDRENSRAIFIKTGTRNTLEILNLDTFQITFSQLTDEIFFTSKYSQDGKYYVQYTEEYSSDEPEQNPSQKFLKLNSFVSIKSSLVYLMEKTGIMSIYDEYVTKEVVESLTAQPQVMSFYDEDQDQDNNNDDGEEEEQDENKQQIKEQQLGCLEVNEQGVQFKQGILDEEEERQQQKILREQEHKSQNLDDIIQLGQNQKQINEVFFEQMQHQKAQKNINQMTKIEEQQQQSSSDYYQDELQQKKIFGQEMSGNKAEKPSKIEQNIQVDDNDELEQIQDDQEENEKQKELQQDLDPEYSESKQKIQNNQAEKQIDLLDLSDISDEKQQQQRNQNLKQNLQQKEETFLNTPENQQQLQTNLNNNNDSNNNKSRDPNDSQQNESLAKQQKQQENSAIVIKNNHQQQLEEEEEDIGELQNEYTKYKEETQDPEQKQREQEILYNDDDLD